VTITRRFADEGTNKFDRAARFDPSKKVAIDFHDTSHRHLCKCEIPTCANLV